MLKKIIDQAIHSSLLVEATRAASWAWDLSSNEVEVNERWAEMIGYTLEELKPVNIKTWERLTHPDDLKVSNAALHDLFDKKSEFYSVEIRMRHKEGHWVWILDSGKVVEWSREGKPLIAAGTHININKRKENQLLSEKNEQNLSQIVENSKDIIYRIALDGSFTYLSRAWNKLLGQDVSSTLGKSFRPFVHPEDLPRINSFFEIIRETETTQEVSAYRLQHIDGTWRYYETSASPIRENGVVVGYAGIARDITKLLSATQELTRQKEELERFFTVSLDLLCIADRNGYFYMLNKAWEAVLGFSIDYLKSKPLMSFVHPDDLLRTENEMNKILDSGQSLTSFVNRYRCFDGSYRYLEWKTKPYQNLLYASARDITEEVEKQKQIQYLLHHDQLTNLYNRRYLDNILAEITDARHLPLGIIAIDLNNLKGINDSFGHIKGDEILKMAGQIILRNIPRGDCVFRMGGDEFVALVEKSSETELASIKDNVIADIKKTCNGECPLSLSFGSYLLTHETTNIFDELKKADDDMYVDKQKYKNART